MTDLLNAFDRNKRCQVCHYVPCICEARTPFIQNVESLRDAIEKGLSSASPLKALAIETAVIEYLARVIPKENVGILAKILGFK